MRMQPLETAVPMVQGASVPWMRYMLDPRYRARTSSGFIGWPPGTQRDPIRKSAVVLHETLHTLGLGENPPSSAVITQRVIWSCAR